MVAKDAIGRNVNGWDFWSVQRGGTLIKLASIRAAYLKSRRAEDDADRLST